MATTLFGNNEPFLVKTSHVTCSIQSERFIPERRVNTPICNLSMYKVEFGLYFKLTKRWIVFGYFKSNCFLQKFYGTDPVGLSRNHMKCSTSDWPFSYLKQTNEPKFKIKKQFTRFSCLWLPGNVNWTCNCAAIAQWTRLRHPSCHPGVESPKEAGFVPLKN